MADGDCISQLGGWAGYGVAGWRHEQRGDRRWLILELVPCDDAVRLCSGCGEPVAAVHDRSERRIRDLPVFEDPVDPHARVTRRLAESVARLCVVTSLLHAAR